MRFLTRFLRLVPIAALPVLLLSAPVGAQTDADKATARTLAEEGIELKKEGKYEEALDKLSRAQQIFNAPTHLLLIAQCQVALGQLVEGAETYRKLQRSRIDDSAPSAFKRAQQLAGKELEAVEPRIPRIRIQLVPENIEDYEIRIDGIQVSAAVVGVDRLANPGHHVVEVSAPGYRTAQVQLQLVEGQVLPVNVKLESEGDPVSQSEEGLETTSGEEEDTALPVGKPEAMNLEFLVGLDIHLAFPNGDLGTTQFGNQAIQGGKVSNSFGSGGGLELKGGLRFSESLAGVLILGIDGFGKVSSDEYGSDLQLLYAGGTGFRARESSAPYIGGGVQWYSCVNCIGFVGELGFMVRGFTQTVDYNTDSCQLTVFRTVPMFRLLAGLQLPMVEDLSLIPFASISAGPITNMRVEPGSGESCESTSYSSSNTEDSSVSVFTLGVAGTLSFGLD